jgi:hypothetical protein
VRAFAFIEAERAHFPSFMCRRLQVSRSGYYAWRCRPPSVRDRADAELVGVIRAIHGRSRGTYGAPRIHAELALEFGIRCGRQAGRSPHAISRHRGHTPTAAGWPDHPGPQGHTRA